VFVRSRAACFTRDVSIRVSSRKEKKKPGENKKEKEKNVSTGSGARTPRLSRARAICSFKFAQSIGMRGEAPVLLEWPRVEHSLFIRSLARASFAHASRSGALFFLFFFLFFFFFFSFSFSPARQCTHDATRAPSRMRKKMLL